MTVIDASVVVEILLATPAAARLRQRIFSPGDTLHAPHLLDIEVAHVLRRYSLSGEVGPRRGRQAFAFLRDLPLSRYPHDILLPRIWELRNNLTAYDAVYVALAEALGAPLVTRDKALAACPGHRARIELL